MTIDQPTYQDPKYTVEYHCVCTVSAYISSLISLVMEDWNNCKRQARGSGGKSPNACILQMQMIDDKYE